ncbi:hypothetical protein OK414_14790 [Priestia sp. JV24]|uniref:hypothetical protein n=1 Tax=Priestia TaxID=2800373 RepID=UPI0021D689DB|nr:MULTISPECIES: hypothetical protein [Priestia]MCU7712484.1 hypothetical protein [Priestia megaterium]MCW1046313.1 hypothetical protein [Priestia sp. JV24]
MLFFAIPLRSEKTTNDWDKIQDLFNMTLKSIYAQVDQNFKVLVACHEKPRLDFKTDDRLEFIPVDYEAPKNYDEQMADKFYKKRYLAKRIRELGAGHIMFVDADDIVSNKISQFVNNNKDKHGWVLTKGYEYNSYTGKVQLAPKFNRLCGTSAIMSFNKDDLPENATFIGFEHNKVFKYVFDYPHTQWESAYKKMKGTLEPLPFIGAIYVTNNGENVSSSQGIGKKRLLMKKLLPSFRPTQKIHNEFTVI